MHESAPRVNGGVGFSVDGPVASLRAIEANNIEVHDERRHPMSMAELAALQDILQSLARTLNLRRGVHVKVYGEMLTHVGMGSATGIRLGALEALALVNEMPLERRLIVAASGRGGTSGIGVNTYFNGGFVCDLGRANDGKPFKPSSQVESARQPLTLPTVQIPQWPMLLCVPAINPKTQEEEVAFFKRVTPLPACSSFEAAYIALFELYAAAAERDYVAFCRGIDLIQKTTWKAAERAQYGSALRHIDSQLRGAGADCVGMSSLGPMLFCFADAARMARIAEVAQAMGCNVHNAVPADRGRTIVLTGA